MLFTHLLEMVARRQIFGPRPNQRKGEEEEEKRGSINQTHTCKGPEMLLGLVLNSYEYFFSNKQRRI